jgi:hypothetical protein
LAEDFHSEGDYSDTSFINVSPKDSTIDSGLTSSIGRSLGMVSLSNLIIYLKGTSLKGDILDPMLPGQILSVTERKALAFINKQKTCWENMTKNNIVRVYPSIMHVTSSNYNPIPHWLVGFIFLIQNANGRSKFSNNG